MKLELVTKTDVSYVELLRSEKQPIGIKLKDATQKESGPAIKRIKPNNLVARSFAAAVGDIVISVNGQLTTGKRKKDVVKMIKEAGSCVSLQLQYKIHEIGASRSGVYRKQQMTTLLRKINDSFGFVLRQKYYTQHCCCAEYPFVSSVDEGNQILKDNQFQDGDRLISVDDLDVSWLSLDEIATILQDKDEAEFTFEYNIRVVNLTEMKGRLDLEIDAPISNIGLSFCMYSDSTMLISNIKRGSIAERCGVFCEGDIILSINGIESRYLTPSKADFLLGNAKKNRRISFMASGQKYFQVLNASDEAETASIVSAEDDVAKTESTSGVETTDWKHVNTPISSNIAFSVQQNYFSQKFCHTEQMKVIDAFQHIVPVITNLKYELSQLTREASNAGPNALLNENCTLCSKTEQSVKLCVSCLTRMNVECEQSMEHLKKIIAQFVNFSTSTRSASPQTVIKNEVDNALENQSIKVSIKSMVIALTETLPKIFDRIPELQESFEILADKVGNADTSCGTCDFEVKSVMLIIKKLLLLISLKDNNMEIADLIERLVWCLLETEFTCDGKSEHMLSVVDNEYNISVSENLDFLTDDRFSLPGNFNHPINSTKLESPEIQNSVESIENLQKVNTDTNLEYLKIVHLQSVSDSQNSVYGSEVSEAKEGSASCLIEMGDICHEVNKLENSCDGISKDDVNEDNKNTCEGKLKLHQKVWRSLDSFFRPKKYAQIQTAIRNKEPDQGRASGSGEINHEVAGQSSNIQRILTGNKPVIADNISNSNGDSTRSFFRLYPGSNNYKSRKKVRTETMEVKMKNHGDGFGLGLGLRFVGDIGSTMLVIHAVKTNSPSHKTGIIKVDDRVVAINHQCTLGLTAKEFDSLRNREFLANSIILKIEFDVIDEEPKFGTFNIVLNRTLKTGLVFEEMKKGSPMVVSGVVKGSAAYRCGQLFKGDEITRFRCIRTEDFDLVSCNYDRDEKIHISVRRENAEGYFNPCFSHDDFVPRNGTNYVLKNSTVRVVRNTESLVYDQELTLFRDLNSWDFGFLVGVDGDTGHAYVTDIRPDSPADLCGVIRKYDRIVKVDGVLVDKREKTSAVALISEANDKVDLLTRRLCNETFKQF